MYCIAPQRATATTTADTSQAGTARRRSAPVGIGRGSGGPSTSGGSGVSPGNTVEGPSDGSGGPKTGAGGGAETAAPSGSKTPAADEATGASSPGSGSSTGAEMSRHSPEPMAGAARVSGSTREATALAARNSTIR